MGERLRGSDPSARGTRHQALANKERLNDGLHRLRLFAYGDGER